MNKKGLINMGMTGDLPVFYKIVYKENLKALFLPKNTKTEVASVNYQKRIFLDFCIEVSKISGQKLSNVTKEKTEMINNPSSFEGLFIKNCLDDFKTIFLANKLSPTKNDLKVLGFLFSEANPEKRIREIELYMQYKNILELHRNKNIIVENKRLYYKIMSAMKKSLSPKETLLEILTLLAKEFDVEEMSKNSIFGKELDEEICSLISTYFSIPSFFQKWDHNRRELINNDNKSIRDLGNPRGF